LILRNPAGLLIAIATLLLPVNAAAQPAPPPPPATAAPAPAPPPTPEAAADARLNALQAQLHISDAQMPQWKAFAQAMRQNASSTDALFRQRAQSVTNMSALDNMKSYAQIARAYADSTQALAEAFEPLYLALNDQQKRTIDTLFHNEAAKNAATQPAKP
jgi:periplasmic protein CpxP/Spy